MAWAADDGSVDSEGDLGARIPPGQSGYEAPNIALKTVGRETPCQYAMETSMGFLKSERDGNVLILTLNSPETRNALNGEEAADDFVQACSLIESDRSVRAVVLTGSGSAFSSGGNVKAMHRAAVEGQPDPAVIRRSFLDGIQRIPQALYNLEVPVIAAVNGPAMGAGLDLACMCDLRIGSSNSTFAESFIRLGLVAGDGGAWLLPRLIGRSAASRLAFTGETIDAAQALQMGILDSVVEPGDLMPSAMALARKIAANPGAALRLTKRLLRESDHCSFDQVLKSSAALQAIALQGPAHLEALNAMLEKRSPQFEDN